MLRKLKYIGPKRQLVVASQLELLATVASTMLAPYVSSLFMSYIVKLVVY